jgi:hypothetical protein
MDLPLLDVAMPTRSRHLLLLVQCNGEELLSVPAGSYMVIADGWRGKFLRAVAGRLYGSASSVTPDSHVVQVGLHDEATFA